MDDGPETAVSIHLENPPKPLFSIKNKIKCLASGIWNVVRKLPELIAPTVVHTPAKTKQEELIVDPKVFGLNVPENTVITIQHPRRFDWVDFSKSLSEEVKRAPKEWKPAICHKAPPIFNWRENRFWDSMKRVSGRLKVPTPDPWTSDTLWSIANAAVPVLKKGGKDNKSAFSNWIYTWGYKDPQPGPNDQRNPDKYDEGTYLTFFRCVDCKVRLPR